MPAPRTPGSGLDLADRRRMSKLVASMTGSTGSSERLGRFEIERLLGEGAFGEVYLAIDPDLRRPLALKLLKQTASADALVRLRKEARAMAALDHADLLTVYEIGSVGERAFIAMELAEGGTLDAWARAEPRSFDAIARQVEVAARGLAAAHVEGFIHRDVKPSNILVGADGRAKVADFGLVHVQPLTEDVDDEGLKTTLAGTPAYMAPEQYDGADPTAKADQYALGVTLFELVYGHRPTRRAPAVDDIDVPSHREQPPRRVPGWLRDAMARALRFDPAQRFPSMEAFADALAAGVGRRKQRVRAFALTTALATAAGAGWFMRPDTVAAVPCADRARDAIAEVWSPARAASMHEAMRKTGTPYASALADATKARIDARASAWADAWTDNCSSAPSAAGTEEATCLGAQRARLDALLDTPIDIDALDPLAAALGDALAPPTCTQTGTRPGATVSAPDELDPWAASLREVEVTLARGNLAKAHASASTLLDEAKQRGATRLVVEAGLLAARAATEQDLPAAAEAPAQDALNAALSVGLDVQASDAALALARALSQRARPDEALPWAELAVSLSGRAGRSVSARAEALSAQARILGLARDIPSAAARCDEAMALADSAAGPTLQSRIDCARTWVTAGRFQDAKPLLDAALEDLKLRYGPQHPKTGDVLLVLAGIYDQASRPDEARAAAVEALALLRRAYGSDDPRILTALNTASGMTNRLGDYDQALALALEGAELARRTLSPGDRKYNGALCLGAGFSIGFECDAQARALADDCVASVRASEKDTPIESLSSPIATANAQAWVLAFFAYQCFEDAEAEAEALEGLERYVDADNVSFEIRTIVRATLANADLDAKRFTAAETKVRELLESTRETTVLELREGMWRTTLAQALAGQGRHAEARDEASRALKLVEGGGEEQIGPERTWLRDYLATP